jgi:hypothetical protein
MVKSGLSEAEERAFVAGVFEGEGTVYLATRSGCRVPRMRIAMKDADTIWRVYHAIGFGSYNQRTDGLWEWEASGTPGANFVALWIGGLLSVRRQEQFDKVLCRARLDEIRRRDGEVPPSLRWAAEQ